MFKRKIVKTDYDKEKLKTVILESICKCEKVAGFKNIHTGRFSEVLLIRNDKDLKEFLEKYDISEEEMTKEY